MAETDLAEVVKRRLSNCCYPLVTNSVLYRDGRFSISESPTEMGGCYGTMDQRIGAHPAAQLLFPELNRRELEEFAVRQDWNGGINHGLGKGHLEAGPNERHWPDVTCSFIIQMARHAWSTGDREFEAAAWDRAKRALERHALWAEMGSGVAQIGHGLGTSYDGYHYEGTTPYVATLWIAALQVSRRWAAKSAENGLIDRIDGMIDAARARMEADLWNGRYYRAFASAGGPVNDNCHAGMMAGEAYARLLAGLDVLAPERLEACCRALVDLNLSSRFKLPPDETTPEGDCAVEYGWLPYVECFGLAALAVQGETRFLEAWERILRAMDGDGSHPCETRLMYQPLTGLPSWGAYYMTAPASWIVYDAMLDFFYAPAEGRLRLEPKWVGRFAVVHPLFWAIGSRDEKEGRVRLEVRRVFADWPLTVRTLELAAGTGSVEVQGRQYSRESATDVYDSVAIPEIELEPGTTLVWQAQPLRNEAECGCSTRIGR
jgi:hypothetical protein